MAIRWQVRFKSFTGHDRCVNIYVNGYTGAITQLIPSDKPFVTNEVEDDDLLTPVRYSTGYISVINQGGLNNIMPTMPKDRFVTLTEGNTVLWQGYIKVQQFSQPWSAEPYTMEFPVISAMGLLDGIQIDYNFEYENDGSRKRIAGLLYDAITYSGATFDKIVFPTEFSLTSQSNPDVMFRLGCISRNWFEYKNENLLDKTESRFEGNSYLYILSELLRAFGYTLYERGTTLYILGKIYNEYAYITRADLFNLSNNSAATLNNVPIATIPISNFDVADKDGMANVKVCSRRAIVEGELNKFEEDSETQFNMRYMNFSHTERIIISGGLFDENLGIYLPEEYQNIWQLKSYDSGSEVSYNAQDVERNYHIAVMCRRYDSTNILLEHYNSFNGAAGWGGYVASIKSLTSTHYAGGYLIFNGSVELKDGAGMGLHPRLKLSVRCGEKYWSGASWANSPTTFELTIKDNGDFQPLIQTDNTQLKDKVAMKLPDDGIFGDIELRIYNITQGGVGDNGWEYVAAYKDLELTYEPTPPDIFKDYPVNDNNRFVEMINEYADEDAAVTTRITSYIQGRMGYGVLLKPDYSAPLQKIYSAYLQEDCYIEESLIKIIYNCTAVPKKLIKIPSKMATLFEPTTLVSYESKNYRYLCNSMDWRMDKQYVTIYANRN